MNMPLGAEMFFHRYGAPLGVSHETLSSLTRYIDCLCRWNSRHNLVGDSTLADPWRRHILDSAQLAPHLRDQPAGAIIADLGSGAGFPGLVLALVTGIPVHLIESKQKKCRFLNHVAGMTKAPVIIHAGRIEAMTSMKADLITARACAPLTDLLAHARHVGTQQACLLALKGRRWTEEALTARRKKWTFSMRVQPSLSSREGRLLHIRDFHLAAPRRARIPHPGGQNLKTKTTQDPVAPASLRQFHDAFFHI